MTQAQEWNTAAIRGLVAAAFSDEELTTLCFDHFHSVYEDFGSGMSKRQKIQRLLDYCTRHGQLDKLVGLVRERNPAQYARFQEGLGATPRERSVVIAGSVSESIIVTGDNTTVHVSSPVQPPTAPPPRPPTVAKGDGEPVLLEALREEERREATSPEAQAEGEGRLPDNPPQRPSAPSPSGPADLPPCPFVPGPMITDPRLFVGRRWELGQIVALMEGVQPVSVNVVGERRIGKSSLLYHFFQTWEQRVRSPERYVVVYLNLQSAKAQRREDFYRAVNDALLRRPAVQRFPDVTAILNRRSPDKATFEEGLATLREQGVLPVLCLDEFEALFRHPAEFDDGFYDALRSLTNGNVLMLVAASRQPLRVYRRERLLTSRFFNDGHVLALKELTEAEATDLVRLPASTVPGAPAALSLDEQRLARRWGGRHPCRLQLAADALCRARQLGRDRAWARREFEVQVENQFGPAAEHTLVPPFTRRLWRVLRYPFWDIPRLLGRLARRTGEAVDDLTNWLVGTLVIIVLILALVGALRADRLLGLLHDLLGG